MRARARACLRASERACVRACVRVCVGGWVCIFCIIMLEHLSIKKFFFFLIAFSISMYIMCVCLFSALSRSVGALQISTIIITGRNRNASGSDPACLLGFLLPRGIPHTLLYFFILTKSHDQIADHYGV